MLYKGQKVDPTQVEYIVIPRKPENLVFTAQSVIDYTEFEQLCPEPDVPVMQFAGGESRENPEHPEYIKKQGIWATRRTQWMILQSLKASKDLVWEEVKYDDPETWHLYEKELQESGLNPMEINRIVLGVISACGMNQERIDAATQAFLVTREQVSNDAPSQKAAP